MEGMKEKESSVEEEEKQEEKRAAKKGEKQEDVGHESTVEPGWTSDLRELIKYTSDLSSLHPRGHPGGTPA